LSTAYQYYDSSIVYYNFIRYIILFLVFESLFDGIYERYLLKICKLNPILEKTDKWIEDCTLKYSQTNAKYLSDYWLNEGCSSFRTDK
jgi:hypothetical protein